MDRIPPSSSNAAPASLSVAALATSNTSIVSSAAASAGSSPSAHARSFSHSLGAAGKRAAAAPAPTGATATACGADGRADSCGAGPSPPIVSHQQLQLQQQHAFHAFQQVGAAHSTELLRSPKSPSRSSQRGGDRERDGGRRSQQSQQQQLQQQYAYAHSDTALSYERQLTAASDSGGWDANSASCGLEVVGRGIYRGGLGIGGPPDGEGLGMDFGFAEAEMPEAHDFLSSTDGTNNGQSYDYGHGGGRYGNMAFSTSLSSPAPQQHHDPAGAAEDASSDGPHSTSGNRHSQQQQQQQQQRGASASPALVATSTTSSLFGIHTAGSFVSLAREALQHVGGREGERRPTDRSYQMGGFDAVPPSAVLPAPAATLSSSAAAGLRQHSLSGQGFSSGSLFGFPTNPSPSSQQQQQHQYPQQQGALLGFAALPFSASSNGLFQPNPRHYLTSSSAAHQHPYDNISNNSTTTATTAGGTLALGTAEDGYPYSASAAEAHHRRLASLPFASVAAQHSAYVPAGAPLLGGSFYSHSASYGGGGGGGPASFLRHSYSKSNLSRQPSFRRMVRTAAQSHSHYRAAGRIGGGGGSHSYASAGAYPPQQYNSSEHRRSHHGHSYHPFGTDALGGTNAPSPASVRASAGAPMHYLHGGGHAGAGSEGSASPFGHHSPLPVSASNKLDVVALSLRASMRLPGQSFAPASAVHSSGDVLSSVGDAAMGFSETPLHPLHGLGALRSPPHSAAAADAPSAVAAEERLASAVWETVKRRPAMMLSVFLDSFFAAMRPPAPSAQAPLPRSRGAASAAGAGSVGKESCANSYAAAASASVAADNNNSSVVLIGTPTVQDEPAALPSDATQYDEKGRAAAATVPPPPPPHPFTDAYDDVTAAPATFAAADTDAYVYEEEVSPAADGEGEGYDGYAAVGVDAYGEDTAAAAEGGGEAYGATLSQVYGACFTSSQRVLTEPAEPLVPFTHSDGVTRCVDNAEGNLVIYVGMVLLGWLEVVSELGSGSFGQVVLCRDLRTVANVASLYERQLDYKYYYTSPAYCDVEQSQGTLVAVKVIGNGETCEAQSYVEAQIMQDLLATQQGDGEGEGEEGAEGVDFDDDPRRHFICRILASGASYGHHCIAMERYSCNLYEYLVSNSMDGLPISVVRAMAHQCLASLALVHGKGYMHCDIKPENIMVKLDEQHCGAIPLTAPCDAVEGGEVDEGSLPPSASACGSSRPPPVEIAVIDFSSSCEIDNPSYYEYIQSRYYRAPEAIVAAPYSTPMDIWSLGCVLAEMLIGRPLLPGANNFHQLNRITEMFGPLPPSLLREGVNTAAYYHCPPQHHHAQQEQQQQQQQGQGEDGQEGQQYYAEEGAEEGYSQQHMHHTTSSSNGDGFVAFSSLHASLSNGGGAIAPPHGSTDGAPNNSSGVTFKNSYGGNADDAVLGVSGEEGEDGEGANGEDGDAMAAVGGGTSPSHPCLQTLPPHTTMAQLLAMHEGGEGTNDDQSEGAGAHGGGGGDADVGEECGADAAAAHMSSHAEMSELCAGGYAAASAAAVVGCGGEAFAVSSTRPPLFLVGEAGRYDTMGQRCPAAAAALAANVSSSTPFACPNVPTAAGTPLVLEEAAVAAAEGSHAFGSSKRPSSVAAIGIGIFASDRAGSARNLSAMTGHGHSTATGTAAPTLSVVTGEGDGSADPSLSSASYARASPPGGGYPHPPTLGPSPASPCGIGHGFGGQRHSLNPTADAAIAAAAAAAEGNTHARPSGMPRRSVDASKNSTEGFGGASLSASPSTPFCPPPLPSGAATVPPVRQCAGASLARPTPLSLQPTGPDGEAPTGVDVGFAGPGGFAITPSDEGPSPNSDDVLVSVPNSGGFQPALGGLPLPLAPAAMASPTSPHSGGGSAAFLQQRDQTCEFFEQPSAGMGGAMGFGLPPNSGASAAATPDRADGKGRRGPALKPLAVRCLLEDGEPSAAKDSGQGHGLGLGGEDCGYGGELLQTQDTTPVAAERRRGEGDGNNGGGWKVADGPRAATGATNGSTSDASSPNANSTGMGRSLHGLHQSHGSSQWSPTHHYYGGSSGAGAGGGSVGGGPYPHHSASLHSASISAASPPQFPPSASSPSVAAGVAEGYAMMSEAEFCALHGCEPAPWLRYLKYDTLHEIVQHMRLSEEEQLLSRRGLVRQRKALYQFLRSMLQVDPRRRPSAEELLAHPFITQRYVATGTASSASGAAGGGRVGGPLEGPIGGQ